MLTRYTEAALVAESRVLSHPASIEKHPDERVSGEPRIHGLGAGRKLWQVFDNVARVVAVELLCAAQGAEHRLQLRPGAVTVAALSAIREVVPPLDEDRSPAADIGLVAQRIEDGTVGTAVSEAVGAS